MSRISPERSSANSASSRATAGRAQDCPNDWQDCPNAFCLVRAKLRMRVRAGGFTYVLLQGLARWVAAKSALFGTGEELCPVALFIQPKGLTACSGAHHGNEEVTE